MPGQSEKVCYLQSQPWLLIFARGELYVGVHAAVRAYGGRVFMQTSQAAVAR
jgi:hypothetical protein